MLSLLGGKPRLCDGLTRREVLRVGGLSALGLSLPNLLKCRRSFAAADNSSSPAAQALSPQPASTPRAKNCVLLFLMGGPPQHSTWDPKPEAPAEVRGEFAPIDTAVPGMQISEGLPQTARSADKLCLLRGVSSEDNAHSSSGYFMLTGRPHQPMNFENANPGAPNDFPSVGALVGALEGRRAQFPPAVSLPHRIFNTNGSIWPGQDAGFLGRAVDPWLVNCQPASPNYHVDGLSLPDEVPPLRLERRRSLLEQLNSHRRAVEQSGRIEAFDADAQQAFDLLTATSSRRAFQLEDEPPLVRERYGLCQFGQSVLLGRRLIEAGVKLVQVNWYRGPDEPMENPCWDSHVRETDRLRTVLLPPFDRAYSALLEDLSQRGMLEETLVVCMAEFGRSPKMNTAGGRHHWGYVYSVALAGGGVRGGHVHGASDKFGGHPKEGRVRPQDLTATILDSLGYAPETLLHDRTGRPFPISTGDVITPIV